MEVHVCSLSRLARTVADTGARHVVTLINVGTPVERPASVAAGDHLFLGMNDIVAPMDGYIVPAEAHVVQLLGFVDAWWQGHGRQSPIVIHCWAGISRSTAAAFITACAIDPSRSEADLAHDIRRLSPAATPNARLVEIADRLLDRQGRMVSAIAAIGRGRDAFEGDPFALRL